MWAMGRAGHWQRALEFRRLLRDEGLRPTTATGSGSSDLSQLVDWFIWGLLHAYTNVGVSIDEGTPKWLVYNGKSNENG